jgi:hypothetical protein
MDLLNIKQQSVTKITSLTIVNLVTPKAGAEYELCANPASDSLNSYTFISQWVGFKIQSIL